MAVPQVDVDSILRRGLVSPQIARGEADRVEVLRVLAEKMGVCVREDKYAVIPFDGTGLPPSVARKPRMTGGIEVARANALADAEFRLDGHIAAGRHTLRDKQRHLVDGERGTHILRVARRLSALELRARDQAAVHEQLSHADEEFLVVADAEIFGRRNELFHVARRVDVPLAPRADQPVERKDARFPACVEDRLVLLQLDGPHAVHAAHIVDAVHNLPRTWGADTLATPIIESRVTRSASCSSPSVSVPAGRSGMTM